MLAVVLVMLWCAVACAGALMVGRSVGVADAEARAAATATPLESPGVAAGAVSEES